MKRSKRLVKILLAGAMLLALALVLLFGAGFPGRSVRSSVSREPAEAERAMEYIAAPAAPLTGPPACAQAAEPASVRLTGVLTPVG